MGACASVPKDIKANAAAAPLPEQPKEDGTTTTAPEVTAVDKKVNGEDGEKVVAEDIEKSDSIGLLITESEAAKDSSVKDEKSSETTDEKPEAAKDSSVKDEKSSETTDEKPEAAKVSDEIDAKQPAAAEEKST